MSNLILTALLYREVFGVMMLITTIVTGIQLFTDVGIGPCIIQSKRGNDADFLNTAWTMQVIRGFTVFLVSCLMAWPISLFYENSDLLLMTPAAGINAVIGGFTSTKRYTLTRDLSLRRMTLQDLGVQILTIPVTALFAWWLHSPWALLIGWSFGETVRVTLSHVALPGPANHFKLDKASLGEVVHFGRWIFLSTALTFFAMRSDALVLGRLFSDTDRGNFWVAQTIALVIPEVFTSLAGRVIFPTLTEVARSDASRVGLALQRFRAHSVPLAVAGLCVLAIFGQRLVGLLYRPEYYDAGWMLRILAAGYVMRLICSSSNCVWLAIGDSFRMMTMMAVRIPILFGAMLVGGCYWGAVGTVVGVACVDLVCYPYVAWALRRRNLWNARFDVLTSLAAAGAIALGAWLV